MSNKDQKSVIEQQDGELSEQQLDSVAGGQQVVKLEKMTITAKREQPTEVVRMDKVTVTAKRDAPLSGTQIASVNTGTKTN
jgi:hypothetical protein